MPTKRKHGSVDPATTSDIRLSPPLPVPSTSRILRPRSITRSEAHSRSGSYALSSSTSGASQDTADSSSSVSPSRTRGKKRKRGEALVEIDATVTATGTEKAADPPNDVLLVNEDSSAEITIIERNDLSGSQIQSSSPSQPTSTTPSKNHEPLSSSTCPICFSLFTNPTITPCGHIFCGQCLFTAVRTTLQRAVVPLAGEYSTARCPVCRAAILGWDGRGGGVIGLKPRVVLTL